jgi:hypothetical protein
MLEDELRGTFAAKAGAPPPRSLASLDGAADAAIRGAGRVRRRRRAVSTGLTGFVAVALASIAVAHVLMPGQTAGIPQAGESGMTAHSEQATSQMPTGRSVPPAEANHEVDAIGSSAQAAKKVRLQLPDKGTVAAAYQAKDGYLVVNTQPSGDQQLVLQDENDKQQVLVPQASNITVAKDGDQVAWAAEGQMNVGTRTADNKQIITSNSVDVPVTAVPVTFVGSDLVLGREEGQGFDVWYTARNYDPKWDLTVLRVFGAHPDGKSLYAEVKAADPEKPMCLALLLLGQPFKLSEKVCGLPPAAKAGGRISPDGHWFAYPVDGAKQVAILDLKTVFDGSKPKLWNNLAVGGKTVWLNPTTFVVDNGTKFLALDPTGTVGKVETIDEASAGVVLIEPLAPQ